MITEEQMKKLPKYVQDRIGFLERELATLKAELSHYVNDEKTSIAYDVYGDRAFIPEDAEIEFVLDEKTSDSLTCRLVKGNECPRLEVTSKSIGLRQPLMRQRFSNMVEIFILDLEEASRRSVPVSAGSVGECKDISLLAR